MPEPTASAPPALHCIVCHCPLTEGGEVWTCASGHRYLALAGIIDCRPPVEGFDVTADRRLAEEIVARPDIGMEALLRWYWAAGGPRPPELVERFVAGDLIGADRAAEVADQIEQSLGRPIDQGEITLEVGSGTAALGTELARRCRWVVATDISLAWLALARHRLKDAGMANVLLVAASADVLPFAAATFDLVVAADVIEHVPDPEGMVTAAYRVLRDDGTLWLSTPNRYSLTPEPHVRVWGVGWLPRPLGVALVRRVRGVAYEDIKTLSAWRLHRLLAAAGGQVTVQPPPIPRAVQASYGPLSRRLIDGYGVALRLPVARTVLRIVAPLFHGTLRKQPADG